MNDVNSIDNTIHCECGGDVSNTELKTHENSQTHQRYVNLKKAYQEALSKPVQVGIAS